MRWFVLPAFVLGVSLGPAHLHGEEGSDASLTRARAQMVEDAQAYRASLERLLAIQQQAAARAASVLETRRHLFEAGILSRAELMASEGAAAAARDEAERTRRRLAESELIVVESVAALDLARANAATATTVVTPTAIGSRGDAEFTPAAVHALDRFFAGRFARPLPVSARGQTPVHDRLGLDHRQAVDVAVHPDSEEGRAIIDYLQRHRIPFLAFRGVLPGASTGAHVHVGRVSSRLVPAGGGDPLDFSTAPGRGP